MSDSEKTDLDKKRIRVTNDSDSKTWEFEDSDGNISISTSSPNNKLNIDGSIQVDNTGTVSYGLDKEKIEKRKKVSKVQLKKVKKLIDLIIDNVSQSNSLSRSEIEECKSDLKKIREMERDLEWSIDNSTASWIGNSKPVLEPDQLQELNDLYDKWK